MNHHFLCLYMDSCKAIMDDNHPFCGLSRSRRREFSLLLIGLSISLLYVSVEKITQSGTGTGRDKLASCG